MQGLKRHSTMASGQSKPQRLEPAQVMAIGVGDGVKYVRLTRSTIRVKHLQSRLQCSVEFSQYIGVQRTCVATTSCSVECDLCKCYYWGQ